MAKSDFPALRMVIEGGRLIPATAFDQERIDSYRNGTKVQVRLTDEKDRVLIRKWFAILGLVLKTCETPWKTREEAHEAIKLALGIVNLTKTVGGQFMQYPRSLSELDDPELQDALDQMIALLSQMTGVDVETLRKESADVGRDEEQPNTGEADLHEDAPVAVDSPAPTESTAAAGEDHSPTSSPAATISDAEWLLNVTRMLLAATRFNGDLSVLENQKKAALLSFPKPEGVSKAITGKANSVFAYCKQITIGQMRQEDGLEIIAGVVGVEPAEILKKAGEV